MPAPPIAAPGPQDPCALTTDSAQLLDTFSIALLEPVELSLAHVLDPTNDSERLLFTNLFDNLIRVDCRGAIRAELAESWAADSDGGAWTLSLRENARLRSGEPVSAIEVAAALASALSRERNLGIDSARALDQRQLRVFRSARQDSIPRLLAHPALAVLPARLAFEGANSQWSVPPSPLGSVPAVEFRFLSTGDPRDALDRGVDLLVTRDPALIDYAGSRSELNTFPLPWSRTYVLLQPVQAKVLEVAGTAVERQSFARDAVQADARGAEPLPWWNASGECPAGPSGNSALVSSRIAYIRGDLVARGLAERIVALADPAAGLRTIGLEPPEFAKLLHQGSERAYILALPRQSLAPCRDSAALPQGARIQPLIDTRAHAIVREGAPSLSVDWDGTVQVTPR